MNESSPFTQFGQVRRLVVTIVVGSAAAVTASVVLNEHPAGAAGAKPATAATAVAHSPPPAPVPSRRVEWRDPWKRPASDPSLPDAAKALEVAPDPSSDERAPTF